MMAASDTTAPYLADRMGNIQPSAIMEIVRTAAHLKAEGEDVIDLSIGEPDFDTPDHIKQAAATAMAQGLTKYTPVNGLAGLVQAIRAKFRSENQLDFGADQIAVAGGAKQIIFNALLATLNDGDEVIITTPYWPSYPEVVLFAGAKPVLVHTSMENGFRMTAQDLSDAITDRTKWVILNSPSNPTGACYAEDELRALAKVLRAHPNILIMSDEIYEHLQYDGTFASLAILAPALQDRTLIVNGISKAYAMTGWRLGYAAGPAGLIRAMTSIQGHAATQACTLTQAATIAALSGPQDIVRERCDIIAERCDMFHPQLQNIDGLECVRPGGAFYMFPSCAGLIGRQCPDGTRLDTDTDVAKYLLEVAKVCCIPGSGFGASPFLRLSFAAPGDTLTSAADRISTAIARLN